MASFLRYSIICLVLAASLKAQAIQSFDVNAAMGEPSTNSVDSGSYAAKSARTWNRTIDLGNGQSFKFNPTDTRRYGWQSIRKYLGNALKNNPKSLVGFVGINASIAGLGWVIDELTNQVTRTDSVYPPQPNLGWQTSGPAGVHSTPEAACAAEFALSGSGMTVSSIVAIEGSTPPIQYQCMGRPYPYGDEYAFGIAGATGECFSNGTCISVTEVSPVTALALDGYVSNLTDKAAAAGVLAELERQGMYVPPGVALAAGDAKTLTGPATVQGQTQTTTTTTPAGTKITTKTQTHGLTYAPGKVSVKTTEVTTVNENGVVTETSTSVNDGPTVDSTPAETEAPEFLTDCEFFPTACAFFEWVQDPFTEEPEPLPPVEHLDGYAPVLGSSGGSCPAPISVDTSAFGSIQVSYQPLCDFAGILRFLVVAGALLFAIYINMGIARGGN